jgi:hypothetical protein
MNNIYISSFLNSFWGELFIAGEVKVPYIRYKAIWSRVGDDKGAPYVFSIFFLKRMVGQIHI